MGQGKIACLQSISPQFDEGSHYDGKIGNPDGHKEYQKEISPCKYAFEIGQLFLYGARTLPSHQPVGMPGSNGILQHPHKNTNQHKNGRKGCRFSEIYGRQWKAIADLMKLVYEGVVHIGKDGSGI